MTVAALLDVDACPMEGIDKDAYDRILGLNGTGYRTVVTLALGYRSADDKYARLAKVRYDVAELVKVI
jgi:nitroreductase